MKQRFLPLLAAASLLATATAATRPHYGGTLRVESHETITSLDSSDLANTALGAHIAQLITPAGDGATPPFRALPRQGTGPLVLVANDTAAGGRPFVDRIEITMGRTLRDQALDFDLGKADVIELSPEQARRTAQDTQKVVTSAPLELLALVLQTPAASADDRIRQALNAAINRDAIHSILLQRQGEAVGGLLPQWVSGYAFLFPTTANPARARDLVNGAGGLFRLTLAYEAGDSLAKLVADRVAVNARDGGILLQTYGESPARMANADVRLVRLRIDSSDAKAALAALAQRLDPAQSSRIANAVSPEELYAAERALIESAHVVPLAYVPEAYAIAPRVHDWVEPRSGGWPAANAWVEGGKP